jgi:hypothetical protein
MTNLKRERGDDGLDGFYEDEDATTPLFVMPPVEFRTINYVRLTVPAVRAMFPVGFFRGGIAAHLPLFTDLRLEVDGELHQKTYGGVELSDTGSSSIRVSGVPFEAVGGKWRTGIRRMNGKTLVLVLVTTPQAAIQAAVPEAAILQAAVPEVAVPEVAVPEVAVPEVAVPEVAVPEVAVPEDVAP